MEDLVLANAGVDAFEEVFKLIYAKLYDEWNASRPGKKKKYLEFRIGGSSPKEFYERIDRLFKKAKEQWPGVFLVDEKIELTPAHLITCGSFLEDIKLFNSNLQIIDEAFEYLSIQVGKGSKGQYFTPRHVIDMCVKMLHPTVDEYMTDGPKKWQSDYASQFVYGIDFDARSVKIAKALNLIAGDGRTNVYKANTLDPRNWNDEVRVGLKDRLRRFPEDSSQDGFNQKNYRYFNFDVLMTNPPFAGDIKDARILHQFDLVKKDNKKWQSKAGRDILFIERNLEFLRPGGRMCIVLPQGRYNNSSDEYIRSFIAEKARILAVVGLHVNSFKPHTGTKTSVLFLQKWNDDSEAGPLCPVVKDYPIFFATSQNSGKDNSGDYIFRKDEYGIPIFDDHQHMIVEHDLDDIAKGFVKFAKRHKLSFWQEGE
jgi:type I restriction enzyme M protein